MQQTSLKDSSMKIPIFMYTVRQPFLNQHYTFGRDREGSCVKDRKSMNVYNAKISRGIIYCCSWKYTRGRRHMNAHIAKRLHQEHSIRLITQERSQWMFVIRISSHWAVLKWNTWLFFQKKSYMNVYSARNLCLLIYLAKLLIVFTGKFIWSKGLLIKS